ncbi:PnuC protein [Parasalinivibrio latis]|uniref:PnuC protein n=1 Tax=Parasalinivibrio latis TaxID=2952610 RepID=UPI0030E2663C
MELWQYFGIDWAAMVLTFLAIWQIGNKNRVGFVLMMVGNGCWVSLGVMTGSLAMVVANVLFLLMNVRALLKWSREA